MTEFINPIGKIREKFGNVIERLVQSITNPGATGPNTGLNGVSPYLIVACVCVLIAVVAIVIFIVSRKKKEE